jgi:hypothetical protein
MEIDCAYDELIDVNKLVPHPRNNNQHPIEQLEEFARILKSVGVWRHPIVVSRKSGFIISGHGRLTVAKMIEMEKVPVNYQEFENEAAEVQQLTFDNEIARWAKLDRHAVHLALEELPELEQDFLGIENFDFEVLEPEDLSDKNKEIDTDNFGNDLQHQCPKCGFEFNG